MITAEDIEHKQMLINKGMRYTVRRINPMTRDWLAETYAATLQEARDDAAMGSPECRYEIRDLVTNRLIQRAAGAMEAHVGH